MQHEDPMRAVGMSLLRPKPGRRRYYTLVWRDPATGDQRQESTGTTHERRARRAGEQLAKSILAGTYARPLAFEEFERLYLREGLAGKSRGHRDGWQTTARHVLAFAPTVRLDQIDATWARRWQAWLGERMSEGSVSAYSTRLRAALNWAAEAGALGKAPKIHVGSFPGRGRPLTVEEFERLGMAAAHVRPADTAAWQRFMAGLFYSGLRLGELRRLSWDADASIRLEPSEPPVIHLARGSHKGKRRDSRTVIPEFWALVVGQPRRGFVFPIGGRRGRQMSPKRLSRIISEIGERAGIVTDPGRHATAHDLRRSYGRYLQVTYNATIREVQLQLGHRDVRTTVEHYDQDAANRLAAKVWKKEK